MKKIATITFHASYNYGSNLQAYALQTYLKKICSKEDVIKIINYRSSIQSELYKNIYDKKGSIFRKISLFPFKNKLKLKEQRFEKFIKNYMDLTSKYDETEEKPKEIYEFDYYISGSDQLWNVNIADFSWDYFLEFVTSGKKISYAASFGPSKQNWTDEQRKRVEKALKKYTFISVRENGSYKNVNDLTGIEPEINVDPTMLLTKDEWEKLINKNNIPSGDYILLYDLRQNKEIYEIAKKVSKITGLPIIITKYSGKKMHFSNFKKMYDCGPIEFLSLLKNAKLVLSSSFHGTVFSVIFHKPFYAINGSKDFRISTLLEKMGLTERTIDINNIQEKCKEAYNINFEEADKLLEEERKKSKEYLEKALDIKKDR